MILSQETCEHTAHPAVSPRRITSKDLNSFPTSRRCFPGIVMWPRDLFVWVLVTKCVN